MVRVSLRFGPLLLRSSLLLVMQALVLSALGVHLLALPTFATPGFERFFGLGRAIRFLVPLGCGRFMHLVVLCGYHGADSSAERLQLTNQLFEAAMGELAVVARGQPCLIVGDFNVEPTKIPCLAKGISAGLWVDLEASWAAASGRVPAVTCKRTWDSDSGNRREGFFRLDAHCVQLRSCPVELWVIGGFSLILRSLVGSLLLGLLYGFILLMNLRALSLLRLGGSGKCMTNVLVGSVLMMLEKLMTLSVPETYLVLGLLGLVLLLRERWLMLFFLAGGPILEIGFYLGGVLRASIGFVWVGPRCVRLGPGALILGMGPWSIFMGTAVLLRWLT